VLKRRNVTRFWTLNLKLVSVRLPLFAIAEMGVTFVLPDLPCNSTKVNVEPELWMRERISAGTEQKESSRNGVSD
jgi:hypothetical protein